jgi:voltage-gated potassium channel
VKARGNAERQLAIAAGILGILLVGGAIGFRLIEGWGWLDSTYTAVIIFSTVGCGVRPLSSGSEAFAIGLTVCGVGTAAYAFGTISRIMVEGYVGRVLGERRLKRLVLRKKGYSIVLCERTGIRELSTMASCEEAG